MRFILVLLRLLAGLLILATSLPAILALFGFAVPFLDIFNHLQLLLFIGTLVGLITVPLLGITRIGRWLAVAGFLASAWTFVPEWGLVSMEPPGSGAGCGAGGPRVTADGVDSFARYPRRHG